MACSYLRFLEKFYVQKPPIDLFKKEKKSKNLAIFFDVF
jgi:hypothetical protein